MYTPKSWSIRFYTIILGNEVSVDSTMKLEQMNSVDYSTIREEWLDMMKPMIHKRMEWVVDRICEYDILWTECAHGPDDTED